MQRISPIQDDKLEIKQGKWEKKLPFEVIEIVRCRLMYVRKTKN